MSTPNCTDFCTAQECFQLRQRIEELQFQIDGVLNLVNQHLAEDIPQAHNYEPTIQETFVTVDVFSLDNENHVVKVGVNGVFDEDRLTIEEFNPNTLPFDLTLGLNSLNQIEISGQLGEQFVNDSTELPNLDVALGVFEMTSDSVAITMQVGESRDEDILYFPTIEPTEHIPSNLSLSGSYFNDILTLSVADGESQDTAQVFIDADINNFGGGGGSDLSCDNFSLELQDCCGQLLAAINANQNAINNNFQKIQEVENFVTIDISGTADSDYNCEPVLDKDGQPTADKEPKFTAINYNGIGISGLHENLKIINQNLASIYGDLCGINTEPQDVVAIVASDKDLHRVKTKVLILQLVLLDVFPRRSNTDSLWQVQIPAAKDSYSWGTNFEDLRRVHGSQYAELQFNEPYVPVSGWFRDIAAANAFFDAILPLTNATEKNRVMPNHSNPEMDIAVFETRPYRAFIKSINAQGKAVCHAQYKPVIELDNSNGT